MCLTAKESSMALAVLIYISLLLYIRNNKYDRIVAALFIVISMIQFIELLYHTKNISSENGGKSLYVILLLQPVILATGLYFHFKSNFTLAWLGVFLGIFIGGLIYSSTISFSVTKQYGHLVWSRKNKKGIFNNILGILYLLGLFIPFFIIQYYNNWKNVGIWILLSSLILSSIFVVIVYPDVCFSSMWCYSSIFVIFTAWLIGAFDCDKVEIGKGS